MCKGKPGVFPGHLVENTEDGKRCGDPKFHFKMGVKCRAVGNYKAKVGGAGAVVAVVKGAGSKWQACVGKVRRLEA